MDIFFACSCLSHFEDPRLTLSTVEADWSIKTDKTERPQVGASVATLLKTENELQFQGTLAAIEGNGGLVGFAFIEAPVSVDLSPYKYIEFYAKSKEPRVVFTLTLKDDQAQQNAGTLTFEQEFVVGTDWTKVKLPLNQFTPRIRGRLVDSFQLDLGQVRSAESSSASPDRRSRAAGIGGATQTLSLSFQINRSKQEPDSPIPLEFGLDVGSQVLVTNQE